MTRLKITIFQKKNLDLATFFNDKNGWEKLLHALTRNKLKKDGLFCVLCLVLLIPLPPVMQSATTNVDNKQKSTLSSFFGERVSLKLQ